MSCSKLVSLLDKSYLKCGENGHVELGWSKNIRERIVQFYFQLVRTSEVENLDITYTNLIIDIIKEDITKEERDDYLSILYKMIAHTRDIVNGKGEYKLAYMMIACWGKLQYVIKKSQLRKQYESLKNNSENELTSSELNIIYMFSDQFYIRTNQLAYLALESFLSNENVNDGYSEHPIGSFKDVKYFIDYWRSIWIDQDEEIKFMDSKLINLIIEYTNSQLRKDIHTMITSGDSKLTNISLVSKWIPREKSKFGWMTKYFARQYFSDQQWFLTAKTIEQQRRAEKKTLTSYRKLLSKANTYVDTTQIKQCTGKWSDIDFDKNVTSITLSKQKQAFMNVKKSNRVRYHDNVDRVQCAKNFKQFIQNCKIGTSKIKGKRVSIYDFVKDASEVITQRVRCSNDNEATESVKTTVDTINLQWKDNSTINRSFNSLIAMVDTSGSMSCDNNIPLYNAIGLGIRIAERSTLGKRILTFDYKPNWFNLNDCPDFVSCVDKIQGAPWGMNTNFYLALEKILQAYVDMDLSPEEVEKYGLVILSDMQIDACVCDYTSTSNTMFDEIERKFALVGINSRFQKPYKAPFIVFWNLRKTNGFPTSAMTKNVTMVSGYSPYLLNQFLERGIDAFTEYNSWEIMVNVLEHHRYQNYQNIMKTFICSEIH